MGKITANRPLNVVVSAFIGVDNLGDQAITQVLARLLAGDKRIGTVTLLSRDPAATARIVPAGVRTVAFSRSNLRRELRGADCLVLGGGGIINDQSSVLSLLHYYRQMAVAKRVLHRPVYWLFVGVGPMQTAVGRRLLRSMSRLVSHALVRDPESAELLRRHGFAEEQITTAYDAVFNYDSAAGTAAAVPAAAAAPSRAAAGTPASPYMLFCPRDWFFLRAALPTRTTLKRALADPASRLYVFRDSLLRLVTKLLQDDPQLTVVGVPLYAAQDLPLLRWMAGQLDPALRQRFAVQERHLTTDEFIALARPAEAVVGVRLHSLILGALARRPLVALTYSSKVQNLTRYLGLAGYTTALSAPDFDVAATAAQVTRARHEQRPDGALLRQIAAVNRAAFDAAVGVMAPGR